ncbi:MAG: GyrI-like domain-containing protein [Armatimonadia bacterium]
MPRLDPRRLFKDLYNPPATQVVAVTVPEFAFFMVDGAGDPNGSAAFQAATEALYALAYSLKFARKKTNPEQDYAVMPLEGLWWSADLDAFDMNRRQDWRWTLMIMQPPRLTDEQFAELVEQTASKKPLPALSQVRFETFDEGLSVQTLHRGPYSAEAATVQRLHAWATGQGYELRGKHHEIYLSDPRRTAPEKLKTIIRQPIMHTPQTVSS